MSTLPNPGDMTDGDIAQHIELGDRAVRALMKENGGAAKSGPFTPAQEAYVAVLAEAFER